MSKNINLIIILLITCLVSGKAQEPKYNEKKDLVHAIGVNVGMTSGVGLSYRYMPKALGAQVTLGYLGNPSSSYISTGGMLLYKITEGKHSQLNLYTSAHLLKNNYIRFNESGTHTETMLNFGVGISVDLKITSRTSLSGNVGYGAYDKMEYYSMDFGLGCFYKF